MFFSRNFKLDTGVLYFNGKPNGKNSIATLIQKVVFITERSRGTLRATSARKSYIKHYEWKEFKVERNK